MALSGEVDGGRAAPGCDVYETGFERDRGWGVVDVATGTVLTARRAPELLFASARLRDGGEVEIQLPDGQVTDSSAVLSAWLQRDVRLDRASDEGGVYENPRNAEGVPPTAVAPVPDVPDGDELLSVVLMVDLVVEVVVSVEVFVGTGRSTRGGFVPHASTARWASRAGDTGRTPVVFSDGQSSGSPVSEMFVASSQGAGNRSAGDSVEHRLVERDHLAADAEG